MPRGITSYLDVRCPTQVELSDHSLERFELTYATPEWEPSADRFSTVEDRFEHETALSPSTGDDYTTTSAISFRPTKRMCVNASFAVSTYEHQCSQGNAILAGISSIYCNDLLAKSMRDKCFVSAVTSTSHGPLSPEILAKNWNIPLERAKQTLLVTTQRGIRSRPTTLTRRFKTNDRMLRYNRLNTTMFTDTLQSGTLSRRQNLYAQAYVIPPNWTKAYAMKTKGDAHHTLSSILRDVGAPDTLVMDGSKEQTLGEFRKKCRDAGVHVHQTEPHSPWQDRAELTIRELKKKTDRAMLKT